MEPKSKSKLKFVKLEIIFKDFHDHISGNSLRAKNTFHHYTKEDTIIASSYLTQNSKNTSLTYERILIHTHIEKLISQNQRIWRLIDELFILRGLYNTNFVKISQGKGNLLKQNLQVLFQNKYLVIDTIYDFENVKEIILRLQDISLIHKRIINEILEITQETKTVWLTKILLKSHDETMRDCLQKMNLIENKK